MAVKDSVFSASLITYWVHGSYNILNPQLPFQKITSKDIDFPGYKCNSLIHYMEAIISCGCIINQRVDFAWQSFCNGDDFKTSVLIE